jgi:phosphoglycerate kinase
MSDTRKASASQMATSENRGWRLGSIRSVRDFKLAGQRVLLRLDLNVPLSEADQNGNRTVTDDTRIREALPTIQYCVDQGAKVVIASHLGRPDGRRSLEFSLEPVALHLADLLKTDVTLADDCIGEGIELMVQSLKRGQVLLLENVRFHQEEEANDSEFAHRLARLGDIYITDAFGTAHRKHASTYGVPSIMKERGIGFLIEKELAFLDRLIKDPAKPFYAILGGSKVSDKIKTIRALLLHLDGLVIGGAMAHAFWAVQGDTVPAGAKQPKPQDIEAARQVLAEAKRRNIPVLVPADTVEGFDIGPKTVERFSAMLTDAKTIFWNGPLGWFEKPEYSKGTFEIAEIVSRLEAVKVIGGGDTVLAIKQSGTAAGFDHLSTGGGAVLEYLELGGLPGIDVLKVQERNPQSKALN